MSVGSRLTVPVAIALCALAAGVALLPCLGSPGLVEPPERQLADRVAPPGDAPPAPAPPPPVRRSRPDPNDACYQPPPDALARSLTARAVELGRDSLGDSDRSRRLPLALLGLLAALATAGLAARAGGGRAALFAMGALVAMPLWVLQSRMLTSEIGTATGGALIAYGLVALATLGRRAVADAVVGSLALIAGATLAFLGGGVLLGLLAPLGAIALAGWRGVRHPVASLPAVVASLAVAALLVVLLHQVFELEDPGAVTGLVPPARQIAGVAVVVDGCWSSALGGMWRPDDNLRAVFDSSFEQIAYGTFPWGLLAPIAFVALVRSDDPRRRLVGGVALAWAAGAWIATEVFQRKVGFTIYAGFPALAVAVGVWLDDLLAQRTRAPGAPVIGLYLVVGVLVLGTDLQAFSEKLTSLLVGNDAVPYPKDAVVIGGVPGAVPVVLFGGALVTALIAVAAWVGDATTAVIRAGRSAAPALAATLLLAGLFTVTPRAWIIVLGALAALGFALAVVVRRRALAITAVATAAGATAVLALFWGLIWQPRLAIHLSSKTMLETYEELRAGDDKLVVMGDLGLAATAYTGVTPEAVTTRDQVVKALRSPERVFAIAPQSELCALHRDMGEADYFVLDARNLRSLLLSNRLDPGTEDQNPLTGMIQYKPPERIAKRPPKPVIWDNKIELIGWDLPARVERGDTFEVVTYFKILAPPGGSWTMLVHVDGMGARLRDGDHKPVKDRCATSTWMRGDYIIDRHVMKTSGYAAGEYDVYVGFFTGSAPNFRNMAVSAAPGDMRDTTDRVRVAKIILD